MTLKKNLINFAQTELNLIGFMDTSVGSSILTLLEDLVDISKGDTEVMKQILYLLPDLVDKKVVSPITENDFEIETHTEGDRTVEILRCTRYPYVYKMDGKYWDDRAVAFRKADSAETDRMYIYQTGNSSKQEITLPYFPSEEVRTLQQEL